MKITVTSPPAIEPISLLEAKQYLRIDHADDDSFIQASIIAAREFVEGYLSLALIEQNIRWSFARWAAHTKGDRHHYVELPRGPLLSVIDIITYGQDDTPQTWAATDYFVALGEGRIYRRTSGKWPNPAREFLGIEINYRAGFGSQATDVPYTIRQALLKIIMSHYDNRAEGDCETGSAAHLPLGVRALLDPYRRLKL